MSAVGQTLTVWVPLDIRQRGGRKQVLTRGGDPCWVPARAEVNSTLVKALARAFRWRRMLEMGRYGTIAELAAAEKINSSYVSRVLRLTLLAPNIVEAILDGRQPEEMTLPGLMEGVPVAWSEQHGLPGENTLFCNDLDPACRDAIGSEHAR
jgi:hypothetical protein